MPEKNVARAGTRAEGCGIEAAPIAPPPDSSKAIRAEISGDNRCKALGIISESTTPVLNLCRKLVAAGVDPALALEAWRGPILCLRIRSIGEAARLEVNSGGTGFEPFRASRAAPPMRHTAQPAIPLAPELRSVSGAICPKIEKHAAPGIAPRFAMPIRVKQIT